ncbi:hypothetical protein HGP14_09430 [Rhizobium sp. P32RR-XVIII]|uniref:hypothetical protein n=1 Tax=Rhizobium sp. P32RR-XVIII TaxID=2726738 RepID=UPI00145697CB|nr:hypothetical protein [Rhizobium sp. P32RR-XVIII]NLS03578.1 hypothetical protein [Rhizobium sp. P32RR-XVIII]
MRPLDQIDADYKKAVDAKHRLLDCAFVVSLSVAIIGLAVLFAMYQALAQADQHFKDQNLIAQESMHHG